MLRGLLIGLNDFIIMMMIDNDDDDDGSLLAWKFLSERVLFYASAF